MIKRLLLLMLFLCPLATLGQGVMTSPQTALQTVNGVTRPIPAATITVCAANAGGIPCSPALVSSIFKDTAMHQPLPNPFAADSSGNYQFAAAPGDYTVTVTAVGYAGFSYQVSLSAGGIAPPPPFSPTVVVDGITVITVAQALSALPAQGGTIDARGCTTGSANLGTYDPGSKEVVLLLGACTYNVAGIVEEPGEQIIGSGNYGNSTFLNYTGTTNNTNVIVGSASLDQSSMLFSNFVLSYSGSASGVGCAKISPSATNTSAVNDTFNNIAFSSTGPSPGACLTINGTGAVVGGENVVYGVSVTSDTFFWGNAPSLAVTGAVVGTVFSNNVSDTNTAVVTCNSTTAFGLMVSANTFALSLTPVTNTGCQGVDIFANEYNGNNALPDSGGSGGGTNLLPLNNVWTGSQTYSGGLPLNFNQNGGSCNFGSPAGINWQVCSNGSDLQWEHPGAGGSGRFHVDADFMVGPPGTATSGANFNSFAWDNEGSWWNGTQAQNNLWEHAVSTTPASGSVINSRENIWPIFTATCTGCTADLALGASGTNPGQGNLSGEPMFDFVVLPRDGFDAIFTHTGFTADQIFTLPNSTGTIPVLVGSFSPGDCLEAGSPATTITDAGAPCGSGGGGSAFTGGAGSSFQDVGSIAVPTNPASGFDRLFENTDVFGCITSTGAYCGAKFGSLVLTNQNTFTMGTTGTTHGIFVAVAGGGASNSTPGGYCSWTSPSNALEMCSQPSTLGRPFYSTGGPASADSFAIATVDAGILNNGTSTTFTFNDNQRNQTIIFGAPTAVAATLPCPVNTSTPNTFANGWWASLKNEGAGTVTITTSGCNIVPAGSGTAGTTATLTTGQGAILSADGNPTGTYHLNGGAGSGGGSGTVTSIATTSPITGGTITATGTIACPTCVTSAAALSANAVIIGGGGQAASALSVDNTATHALFATATAPAFRAIAITDLPNIPLNQIISPTGAVASFSMAANSLSFNWTGGFQTLWDTSGNFSLDNSTAATVSTTNASPSSKLCAHYWATGGVDADSCLGETMSFAAGLNGLATVKFANPATTGGMLFDFSNGGTQSDSLTIGPLTSSTANFSGINTLFCGAGATGSCTVEMGASGGSVVIKSSVNTAGVKMIPGVTSNSTAQFGTINWATSTSQIYTVQFKASASVNAGAAVKLDTANAQEIVMTTNADTAAPIGVSVTSISANGVGDVILLGIAGTNIAVKTENTCAIGNYVLVSTVAAGVSGNVMCSATPTLGITLGKAMSAATGTAGTPATVVVLVQPE